MRRVSVQGAQWLCSTAPKQAPPLDKSHDPFDKSHDPFDKSHDPFDKSHAAPPVRLVAAPCETRGRRM